MSTIYRILRLLNDINALFRGKVGQRIARRGIGRISGRWMRKIR